MHIAAVFAFIRGIYPAAGAESLPWRSPGFSGSLVIAIAALAMAAMNEKLSRRKDDALQAETAKRNPLTWAAAIWGFAWWFGGWHYELQRVFSGQGDAFLIFASISAVLFWAITVFFNLGVFIAGMIPAPITAAVTVITVLGGDFFNIFSFGRPIFSYNFFDSSHSKGWAVFLILQAISFLFLRPKTAGGIERKKYQTQEPAWFRDARLFIVILTDIAVFSATGRFYTIKSGLSSSWTSLAGLLPLFVPLVIFPALRVRRQILPLILSGILGLWFFVSLFRPGDFSPLPFYLPVINLPDFLEGLCIFCMLFWRLSGKGGKTPFDETPFDKMRFKGKKAFIAAGDVMAFLWIASILARSVHNFAALPWRNVPASNEFQLCLFVFWALYGIFHIAAGRRKKSRALWISGAILVTADIAKLVLFDMRGIGAVPRILSFFGAGLVLLFIGWAAPLPPPMERNP
jgi:hypothetical protein